MHVHLTLHFTATVNKSAHPRPHHCLPTGFQFLTQVSKGPTGAPLLFQLSQARPLDSSVLELLQREDGCLPFRKTLDFLYCILIRLKLSYLLFVRK